ncbi:conserved hypothetical protein [Methanocaldococcus sp. FS406-22]|uniref:hypothetical protein n=1 Tax=Methanocaldococcus sp. (strain FS406-22) TaxID=644281 RepID=UPI0001BF3502|nr:hypothetical protein [Methanocaldococcus sp. FS406-22]ADC69806.1 conserved hypothetical protein [Methanocaldococcus sp. FS406-22]
MIYNPDEIYYSPKYINNKIIDEIIKNPKIKKVVIPKSHYELMLKKNPNGIKRLLICGIDIEIRDRRGRPKKVNDDLKKKILELYKNGKTILEISEILRIPKSTIWDNVGEELAKIKDETLYERLWNDIWKFKELAIEEGWYDNYAKALFAELEAYIKSNNIEKANEALRKIIEYRHENIIYIEDEEEDEGDDA